MFSRSVAIAPINEAFELIRKDLVHPPLYYFLIKPIAGFPDADPLRLRFLSLVAGVITILLMAGIGLWFPALRLQSFVAAILLSLNSVHIFYSQQARSYSLYTLEVLALLIWAWCIERFSNRLWFWLVGGVLMATLAYTHHVSLIYLACFVAVELVSDRPRQTKIRVLLTVAVAFASLLPWAIYEYPIFVAKKGLDANLGWQQQPPLGELLGVWSTLTGLPTFRGATSLVLLIAGSLIAYGFVMTWRRAPDHRRYLLTLLSMALVPPVILYLLSVRPISLPIFGARHVLPSILAWFLLLGYGVKAARDFVPNARLGLLVSAGTLIALQAGVTSGVLAASPQRVPYHQVAAELPSGATIYTTWPYGIQGTVNYYLNRRAIVEAMPENLTRVPRAVYVLYRPTVERERVRLQKLLSQGWREVHNKEFSNGSKTGHTVRMARLEPPRTGS
ncbi:MAG TPA: hypothetical protein VE621_03950 [Bryobacteraceae bacterium]|nr:hypothetical protein [Bryobacteraceae bacterium]